MKKVTLALILLVSLSFTAMQNESESVQLSHVNDSFPEVKGGPVKDTLKNDTLADTLVVNEVKTVEKKEEMSLSKALVSWYGGKFHGRLTSSGEKYNMNALTAAHKTLPFGTKVKFTNPKNGKEVIVKITDRGPFIPKREFDLSKAAFAELTSLDAGVLNVNYEIIQ